VWQLLQPVEVNTVRPAAALAFGGTTFVPGLGGGAADGCR
jgi:hypothetical protein